MQDQRFPHWNVVIRNVRYLEKVPWKGMLHRGKMESIPYRFKLLLTQIRQSTFDKRSTIGYCISLRRNLVTRKSRKQNVVARSNAKAKFMTIAKASTKLTWMIILLDELCFTAKESMGL